MNMNSQSIGSKTGDTQLIAFPYYGSEGEFMTGDDVKNGKYPNDVEDRILEILKEFDINDENDSNFKFGVENLSDEDLDRLRRAKEQGLKINSENIFPLASTSLNNEEIGKLKEWQEKVYKDGVVVRTRENLFTLLNLGCTEDNVKKYKRKLESDKRKLENDKRKLENDKTINAMKNEVRKFFDSYLKNNLIIRSDWPYEENDEYYESDEEMKKYRDFFTSMLEKLRNNFYEDEVYSFSRESISGEYVAYIKNKYPNKTFDDWLCDDKENPDDDFSAWFKKKNYCDKIKNYLDEHKEINDELKTQLEFVRDFPNNNSKDGSSSIRDDFMHFSAVDYPFEEIIRSASLPYWSFDGDYLKYFIDEEWFYSGCRFGECVEENFSGEADDYLKKYKDLPDVIKTYLAFIRDFPEIYFFGYKANELKNGISKDVASSFDWEVICNKYGEYKSENGDSSESFKDWLKINYSDRVNSYLDEHNDLSKETIDYLRFIKEFPFIVYDKVDASDSRYLTFDDLSGDFDDQSLATLFFYLKITGKKLLNGKDFYSCLESTIKNLDLDIKSLKFLYERGIYVDGHVISKITNESIDGVDEYLKNNEIDSKKILPIIIGLSGEKKDVKNENTENSVKKYVSILKTFGDYFSKVNHDYECMDMVKKLVNCDERMFDENNFKFIKDNLIEENLIEDPEKFVDNYISYNENINVISLLSDDNFFAKFKEYFPNFTFSPEMVKKLVEFDTRMFDENNLNFIFKYFIPENSKNSFDDYKSCNQYINVISLLSDGRFFNKFVECFPNFTFSPEIVKKLVALDTRMIDENNFNIILEYFISKDSKNPFDDFIYYNDSIENIDMIIKDGLISPEFLDLLLKHFDVERKALIRFRGLDSNKLSKLNDLIDKNFGDVHFKLGFDEIVDLLKEENKVIQLIYLNYFNHREKSFSFSDPKSQEIEDSYYNTGLPYMPRDKAFDDGEINEMDTYNFIIGELRREIEALKKMINEYNDRINLIKSEEYRRYKESRENINANKDKERQDTLNSCKLFFKGGINEDNFSRIYDEFFDIVFDGNDNNFLKKIPQEVINNTEFLTNVINLSLKNGTPHRTFYLYKYLDNYWAFETVYKIMSEIKSDIKSEKSYFGSLIYGVYKYGENEDFYKYILGKYGEMPVLHKVKLLPYLTDIDFKSFDDFNNFLEEIIGEFGILCLEPHDRHIREIFNKLGGEYKYSTYSRDYLIRKEGFDNDYLKVCTNGRLYAPDFDIYSVYDRGSGEFLGEYNSSKYQKFVLTGKVFDSQNIRFNFCTNNSGYHRDIARCCDYRGDCFGGGFLSVDDLDKKIYVYGYSADGKIGSVHSNLRPVITDILNKKFPDYVVEFGNPRYYQY